MSARRAALLVWNAQVLRIINALAVQLINICKTRNALILAQMLYFYIINAKVFILIFFF